MEITCKGRARAFGGEMEKGASEDGREKRNGVCGRVGCPS